MNKVTSPGFRGFCLILDKLGAIGAIFSAAASPCCFPLFATIGGALGLGSVPLLRGNAPIIIQAMTGLALFGQIAAYRQNRRLAPLLISALSLALILAAYFITYDVALIYVALAGLATAAVWNIVVHRRCRGCSDL